MLHSASFLCLFRGIRPRCQGVQVCKCAGAKVSRCPRCPGVLWPFWLTRFISATSSLLFGVRWVSFWKSFASPVSHAPLWCHEGGGAMEVRNGCYKVIRGTRPPSVPIEGRRERWRSRQPNVSQAPPRVTPEEVPTKTQIPVQNLEVAFAPCSRTQSPPLWRLPKVRVKNCEEFPATRRKAFEEKSTN